MLMGDWIGELLMNWEVIDTKASKLTMEKEDFFNPICGLMWRRVLLSD